MRYLINQKYYGRIKMVRQVQQHTIVKDNIDCHYTNAVCCSAHAFYILFYESFMYISRDGKNKMKASPPNEPLAMTSKKHRILVPKNTRFQASNYDMGKKSPLIL